MSANAEVMIFSNLVNDKPEAAKEIIMQMSMEELLKFGLDLDSAIELLNRAIGQTALDYINEMTTENSGKK